MKYDMKEYLQTKQYLKLLHKSPVGIIADLAFFAAARFIGCTIVDCTGAATNVAMPSIRQHWPKNNLIFVPF